MKKKVKILKKSEFFGGDLGKTYLKFSLICCGKFAGKFLRKIQISYQIPALFGMIYGGEFLKVN